MSVDPRVRKVSHASQHSKRDFSLVLECGHVQRRRLSEPPESAICVECEVPIEWAACNLGRSTALPEVARPLSERMALARTILVARKRTPRAFYLNPADYAEFEATKPPIIKATFRGFEMEVLGFDGLAVRQSESYVSKLYCCAGTAVQVPLR